MTNFINLMSNCTIQHPVDVSDMESDEFDSRVINRIAESIYKDAKAFHGKFVFRGEILKTRNHYFHARVVEGARMTLQSIVKHCKADPTLITLFKAWRPLLLGGETLYQEVAAMPFYRLNEVNFESLMVALDAIPHEMGPVLAQFEESMFKMDYESSVGSRALWTTFLQADPFVDGVLDFSTMTHVNIPQPPSICEAVAISFLNHVDQPEVIKTILGNPSDDLLTEAYKIETIRDACRHGIVNPELSLVGKSDDVMLRYVVGNQAPVNFSRMVTDEILFSDANDSLGQIRPMRARVNIFRKKIKEHTPRKIRRYSFPISVSNREIIVGDPEYSEQTQTFFVGTLIRATPLFASRKCESGPYGESEILEFYLVGEVVEDYSLVVDTRMIPRRELSIIKYLLSSIFFPIEQDIGYHPDVWKPILAFCLRKDRLMLSSTSRSFRSFVDLEILNFPFGNSTPLSLLYKKAHCSSGNVVICTTRGDTEIISYRDLMWMCHGANPLLNLSQNDPSLFNVFNKMIGPCFVDTVHWSEKIIAPDNTLCLVPREDVTLINIHADVDYARRLQQGRMLLWYGKHRMEPAMYSIQNWSKKLGKKIKLLMSQAKKQPVPLYVRSRPVFIKHLRFTNFDD